MKVALFGLGRIGQIHLRHLVESYRVKVKYLIDVEAIHKQIQTLVAQYRLADVQILTPEQADVVFKDDGISAVLVCIPINGKAELTRTALKSGKHVFCEKPIALTTREVEETYRTAHGCNKTLQCGFDKRFDTSLRKMHDQIRNNGIGKLRMIKLTARELPGLTWREYIKSSGGIYIDTMVHEFDLLMWLAGERPCSVTSFGHSHNKMFEECGDVDSAVLLVKFPSGILGFLESFRGVSYGYDQRYEVLGSDGMLLIQNPKESLLERWSKDGQTTDQIWQNGLTRYTPAYKQELEHFFDVVEGKSECQIKPDEVISVHRLANSAAQAMETGQVVSISWMLDVLDLEKVGIVVLFVAYHIQVNGTVDK